MIARVARSVYSRLGLPHHTTSSALESLPLNVISSERRDELIDTDTIDLSRRLHKQAPELNSTWGKDSIYARHADKRLGK